MKFLEHYITNHRHIKFQWIKICLLILISILTFPLPGHSKRSTNVLTYLPIKRNANNSFEVAAGLDALTIPLKRVGNLFLIDAVVDNQTGNLIFDTGAMGLVLNRTYYRDHVVSDRHYANGVNGAISDVSFVNIDKIKFSELTFTNNRAELTDLGHIENKRK